MSAIQDKETFASACGLWKQGRLKPAFSIFLSLAKKGDVSSQVNLAHFYSEGLASSRDLKSAEYWLRRAFRGGAMHAATNLGINYWSEGKLVLAEKWLIKATECGDGDAWLELARLYLFGFANARKSRSAAMKVLASEYVTPHAVDVAGAIVALSQSSGRHLAHASMRRNVRRRPGAK